MSEDIIMEQSMQHSCISELYQIALKVRCGEIQSVGDCIQAGDRIRVCAIHLNKAIKKLNDALHQSDHFIVFTVDDWSIEHTVSCRPNMTECKYHQIARDIYENVGHPGLIGKYRMTLDDDDIPLRLGLDKVE